MDNDNNGKLEIDVNLESRINREFERLSFGRKARVDGKRRNFDLALVEIKGTIVNQLVMNPPDGESLDGLSYAKVDNLARTLLQAIDSYGVE